MNKPKIYLAGPITGQSWEEATQWREHVAAQLVDIADCHSPLRHKEYLSGEGCIKDEYNETLFSSQRAIFGRDTFDVRTSELLFVNFLPAKSVSIGTVLEIGIAWELRKQIVIVMTPDTYHWHSMLRECTPWVVDNIDDGIKVVRALYTI